MHNVALLKSEQAFPFIDYMKSAGMPVAKYLKQARLPVSLLNHESGMIVERQLWELLEIVSEQEAMHDFGLRVGLEIDVHQQLNGMMPRLMAQPTLLGVVQAFCQVVHEESSDATFWLTSSDNQDTHWFCRGGVPGINVGERDAELYTMTFMIKLIRLITGPAWWPDTIRLKTNDEHGLHSSHLLRVNHLEFGQVATAIEIPSFALNPHFFENLKETRASATQSTKTVCQPILANTISESLQEMLSLYLATGEIDLQHAADLLGVSPRTLQRQLTRESTNYAKLVDVIRFNSAIPLLKDQGIKLVDIAYDLGYSDPAHFTRAFRRWAGMTPREFRRASQSQAAVTC